MHPAFSVIFFTVLSGFGYGLFMTLALTGIFHPGLEVKLGVAGSIVGLVLVTGGLLSSTLHLANPKNAWRAFSRFKTSWLSREGVLALVFYLPALLYLAGWWFGANTGAWWVVLSWLIVVLALATVFSTGMIYACLKTIRQWHTPLTPINYILLSLMSGLLLLSFLHQWYADGNLPRPFLAAIVFFIALSGIMKLVYYRLVVKGSGGPTPNTATSLLRSKVRLLDVGHTAGTFLTDEFGYQVGARRLMLLRSASLALAFVVPLLLFVALMSDLFGNGIIIIALLSSLIGLIIERWLFFADARHAVKLYHGAKRV